MKIEFKEYGAGSTLYIDDREVADFPRHLDAEKLDQEIDDLRKQVSTLAKENWDMAMELMSYRSADEIAEEVDATIIRVYAHCHDKGLPLPENMDEVYKIDDESDLAKVNYERDKRLA